MTEKKLYDLPADSPRNKDGVWAHLCVLCTGQYNFTNAMYIYLLWNNTKNLKQLKHNIISQLNSNYSREMASSEFLDSEYTIEIIKSTLTDIYGLDKNHVDFPFTQIEWDILVNDHSTPVNVNEISRKRKFNVYFDCLLTSKLQLLGINCHLECISNWIRKQNINPSIIWSGTYKCVLDSCEIRYECKAVAELKDIVLLKISWIADDEKQHAQIKKKKKFVGAERKAISSEYS
jgi:hypothetical protein